MSLPLRQHCDYGNRYVRLHVSIRAWPRHGYCMTVDNMHGDNMMITLDIIKAAHAPLVQAHLLHAIAITQHRPAEVCDAPSDRASPAIPFQQCKQSAMLCTSSPNHACSQGHLSSQPVFSQSASRGRHAQGCQHSCSSPGSMTTPLTSPPTPEPGPAMSAAGVDTEHTGSSNTQIPAPYNTE